MVMQGTCCTSKVATSLSAENADPQALRTQL